MQEASTNLWQHAFEGNNGDPAADLATAYRSLVDRASVLNAQIAQDLPDYTVHDHCHVAGIWELADLLVAADRFNPAEVFVFGAATVLHDLGLAVAAYPEDPGPLHDRPEWQDCYHFIRRATFGAHSDAHDSEDCPAIAREATQFYLRRHHAQRAADLANVSWSSDKGGDLYLIDQPWRQEFGDLVGRVAASHGKPFAHVAQEFSNRRGASARHSASWTVDTLSIAALLRAADAAHVDASRAPDFARAVHRPRNGSIDHWDFQNHLARAQVKDEALVFTSTAPFVQAKADAWWMAHDWLSMVDRELRQIYALLVAQDRAPFSANRVAQIEDPRLLAEHVEADGWTPVRADLTVSNVLALAERLGGQALYGANAVVAIRELIQNAADAVNAGMAIEHSTSATGRITVSLRSPGDKYVFSVSDTGVGMSQSVLTNELLDFGGSIWHSERILDELPGLASTSFRNIGTYGVGFFSTLMFDSDVEVTTRSTNAAPRDTLRLRITGDARHPLLSKVPREEHLRYPGTRVSIYLDDDPLIPGGPFNLTGNTRLSLGQLIEWVSPALGVDLFVQDVEAAHPSRLITGNDWESLSGVQLCSRAAGASIVTSSHPADEVEFLMRQESEEDRSFDVLNYDISLEVPEEALGEWTLASPAAIRSFRSLAVKRHVRGIRNRDGELVGRLALTGMHDYRAPNVSAMVVGGLAAQSLSDKAAGIMFGQPLRASRDRAVPLAAREDLAAWATEQGKLIAGGKTNPRIRHECARAIHALGGELTELPVAMLDGKWLSLGQLDTLAPPSGSVVITDFFALGEGSGTVDAWDPNVFVTGIMRESIFERSPDTGDVYEPEGFGAFGFVDRGALASLVLEWLARAWNVTTKELSRAQKGADAEPEGEHRVGVDSDGTSVTVVESFQVLRPRAS